MYCDAVNVQPRFNFSNLESWIKPNQNQAWILNQTKWTSYPSVRCISLSMRFSAYEVHFPLLLMQSRGVLAKWVLGRYHQWVRIFFSKQKATSYCGLPWGRSTALIESWTYIYIHIDIGPWLEYHHADTDSNKYRKLRLAHRPVGWESAWTLKVLHKLSITNSPIWDHLMCTRTPTSCPAPLLVPFYFKNRSPDIISLRTSPVLFHRFVFQRCRQLNLTDVKQTAEYIVRAKEPSWHSLRLNRLSSSSVWKAILCLERNLHTKSVKK